MTETNHESPAFIRADAPPILMFGGKGGVGKTTCAAAAALSLARCAQDESVCLVSTDPAHSIMDALADADRPPNLLVVEPDASKLHTEFMAAHREKLHEIAARGTFLEDGEIAQFLELSIPGVDELMCFVRLAEWFQQDHADRYVIDTAPTGHTLRLLTMPALLTEWIDATDALLGKHRYMASVFGSGEDPVDAFLEHLAESFDNVAGVWTDGALTRFVPVFNPEPMPIAETERLLADLDELGIAAPELLCNRIVPRRCEGPLAARAATQQRLLSTLPERISERAVVTLPILGAEPRGDGLAELFSRSATLVRNTLGGGATAGPTADGLPRVRGRLDLSGGRRITMLVGKGGVGKTTMACALGLACSRKCAQKTLLVSTDPAGSLADALAMPIGPSPSPVTRTLDAVQLDADAEFDALKRTYADELEAFFDQLMPGASLAFEQEAMERLLDLAPTGIDEVMALVRMIEVLDAQEYGALVLDTAPTGHTLRLLELPALAQRWLEAILSMLVRYEDVFRLPRLNDRLLRLSKGLRSLRTMLGDAQTTGIVGVTVPTRVAGAETVRLIEGCTRAGAHMDGLIVNQVTPTGDGADALSAAVAHRERDEADRIASTCGVRSVCVVERGSEPAGVDALTALGCALIDADIGVRAAA